MFLLFLLFLECLLLLLRVRFGPYRNARADAEHGSRMGSNQQLMQGFAVCKSALQISARERNWHQNEGGAD